MITTVKKILILIYEKVAMLLDRCELIKGQRAFDILEGITLHCEVLGVNEKLQIIPNTKTDPYESVFVYGGADRQGDLYHLIMLVYVSLWV